MEIMTSTIQETMKKWPTCRNEPNLTKTERSKEVEGTEEPRTNRTSTQDEGTTSIFFRTSYVDFVTKYKSFYMLGQGGFGSVFAGRRLADKLPVAIKRIPQSCVKMHPVILNERRYRIPLEVLMMVKAGGAPELVGQSAAVSILNWYDLEHEVVLVMERPVTAVDLLQYLKSNGPLGEDMAKIILKQLVEAAIQMHAARVFHRDIKAENILIENRSHGPRVRVIDFGCARIFRDLKSSYSGFSGTPAYAPPEFFRDGTYKAGPTTVWQLAALLYETLHGFSNFSTEAFIHQEIRVSYCLSRHCQEFLEMCLNLEPENRATLEQMKRHPWLTDTAATSTTPPPNCFTTCCFPL
ncbi:serine/threonine-protein kinase pim-1-like [Solea solea]|uniref:serine/threonine-protein kinase pim-1-like n=1 Tax=Solea solea TaxID=90069 RepID=UPI00272A3E4B|nr:serine/threonine-protein kinase pim-1-like [Solea solea]